VFVLAYHVGADPAKLLPIPFIRMRRQSILFLTDQPPYCEVGPLTAKGTGEVRLFGFASLSVEIFFSHP